MLCCLCRQPILPDEPVDKAGLAHESCAIQEWAEQQADEDLDRIIAADAHRCHQNTPDPDAAF